MLKRLDYLELKAESIISNMQSVESRIADILRINDTLLADAAANPSLSDIISVAQDELELEFDSLVSLFDELEAELNALGDEYDALVFVVSLALPA